MSEPSRAVSWRDLVAAPTVDEGIPLALGVELRQRSAYDRARWEPRRFEGVTPRALAARQDDLVVGLRPLMRSVRTGEWIKGDATWDAVRRPGSAFDPAHARWFAELYSIARGVAAPGGFPVVAEWITLESVRSGLLWPHLATASGAGIAVRATRPDQDAHLASRASVRVEVDARGAGVALRARVYIDGVEVDVAGVRALDAGLFAFTADRNPLPLTLAPARLDEATRALLAAGGALTVPPAEREEFLREAYPHLVRRVEVVAAPGHALPPPPPPEPVLHISFGPGDRAAFRWSWLYPGWGERPFVFHEPDQDAPDGDVPDRDDSDRDEAVEAPVRQAVEDAWAAVFDSTPVAFGEVDEGDAAEFVDRVLPAWERIPGVRVVVDGVRREYHRLAATPHIEVTTVESADADWFDLGIIVTIDGRRIPFEPLFRALARGRKRLLLADGGYFSLAHPALQRLRELLEEAEALAEWETGPRISRAQTSLWADFEDLADLSAPALAWRAVAAGLRDVERLEPAPIPAGLNADLRPYQRAGLDWLAFLWDNGLGGILADDMGLGKTLQLLALILHARERGAEGPFLVVAPTSVLATWREQAARFAPQLRVQTVTRTQAASGRPLSRAVADADVVVTSYTLLRLDEAAFCAMEWAGVILDEAQFVKNPASRQHRAAAALRARAVYAVTGTPLENSLTDLWALLWLTAPGLFPSARGFREEYIQPIEQGKVPENAEGGPYRAARLARLRRRIRPLMLRRTKELVAPELPERQEQEVHVELGQAHRGFYDLVLQRERKKVLGLLDDLDRNRFIVFRSLTLLRLLALAPALIDPGHARMGSAKLDAAVEKIAEIAAEGHRALVFSQFTSFLDLAQKRLTAEGIPFVRLDGSIRRRDEVIQEFRDGDAPVFLISLKAGGFGLTLTEADYVFLLDPWWNPAAEAQAIDRTHRIGQTRNVMVYRLIAQDTIEEKVMALQQRKARLFRAVMDDDELFAQALTAEDIRGLLA